ncbi:MAG TPA: hypothetical protein VGE26_11490 [Sphingobacteriaceae bacterium]
MSAEINPSKNQNAAYDQLSEFFDQYTLPESKAMLWKWFKATVTGSFSAPDEQEQLSLVEKENIVTYYERMNALLDAIHALKHRTTSNENHQRPY